MRRPTAFSFPFTASMRARQATTASRLDAWPTQISLASSVASNCQSCIALSLLAPLPPHIEAYVMADRPGSATQVYAERQRGVGRLSVAAAHYLGPDNAHLRDQFRRVRQIRRSAVLHLIA